MATMNEVVEKANLDRAWRWIRSNPDPNYKRYCGESYSRFAIADDRLLVDIQARLKKGIYEPSHSCKFLIPKKSGILRPYTILTVEDQIVYQALVNVIAEHLAPRIRSRYMNESFGHLYAGKTSIWFYKKWSAGYQAFNKAARAAFSRGLRYAASFDLTACYDSLDHGVLSHFLKEINCDQAFCDFLKTGLSKWTATNQRIYHFHGIPQGPLGSGLLAEVVLQHFDQHYGTRGTLAYLRYVDDIRLFASKESDLRKMLVTLDMLSKDVGLFPQAGKIEIHEVKDIDKELKSISNPTETAVKHTHVDHEKLRNRIMELTSRGKIDDETRFKYLLAHANPHFRLNRRLMLLSERRPDLTNAVMRYFKRYKKLPRTVSSELIARVRKKQLYDNVAAEIIDALDGRVDAQLSVQLDRILKKQWKPRGLGTDLKHVMARRLLKNGALTTNQIKYALHSTPEWWVRVQLVSQLSNRNASTQMLESWLNQSLRDKAPDVSIAAAEKIAIESVAVFRPVADINPSGGKILRAFGLIKRVPGRACGVEFSISKLTKITSGLNWRGVFGTDYKQAETQAVLMQALAETNATAFVNAADVFNDLLLHRLFLHQPALGGYTLGRIGSVLPHAGGGGSVNLRTAYPDLFAYMASIHDQRYLSNLSHPQVRRTGKPTGHIKFAYLKSATRMLKAAVEELSFNW